MAESDLQKSIREQATAGVSSHSVDGETVTHMPIADQIAADKYLAGKKAANGRKLPLRFARIRSGGPV